MASLLDYVISQQNPRLAGLLGMGGGEGAAPAQAAAPAPQPRMDFLSGLSQPAPEPEPEVMVEAPAPEPEAPARNPLLARLFAGDQVPGLSAEENRLLTRQALLTAGLTVMAQPQGNAIQALALGALAARQQTAATAGELLNAQVAQQRLQERAAVFADTSMSLSERYEAIRQLAAMEGDSEQVNAITRAIEDLGKDGDKDVKSINGREFLVDRSGNLYQPGSGERITEDVEHHLSLSTDISSLFRVLGWDPDNLSPEQQAFALQWWERHKRAGAAQTRVNVEAPLPAGWSYIRDEAGRIVSMEMIPGGPAERDWQNEMDRVDTYETEVMTQAGTVTTDATRALDLIEQFGPLAGGTLGTLTGFLAEAPKARVQRQIESLQGNISVDKLLKIKASGAGLGHIPHQQMMMLASVLGLLDAGMHVGDLEFNLRRVRRIYRNVQVDLRGEQLSEADIQENHALGIPLWGEDAVPWSSAGAAPRSNPEDPFADLGGN
jgi:hypothetical protein